MFLETHEAAHVLGALELAIKTRREHEVNVLKYAMDSGQVGAWRQIHEKMSRELGIPVQAAR
jgi:hypothetical protein